MKQKLTAIFTSIVLLMSVAMTGAEAAVYTVEEPTKKEAIYIAGDPDMYPVEYYDVYEKEYKGILPELYKQISEDSGVDFAYINAGTVNEQYRLAKNKQVEIVSAHSKGDVDDLAKEVHILTFNNGDRKIDLCVGFTAIAPDDVVSSVTSALNSASAEELLRLSVETSIADSPDEFPLWLLFVCIGLLLICVILVIWIIKRHKKEKRAKENRMIDTLTGIGNSQYFEHWYGSYISPVSYTLYYIAFIGIDIQRVLQYASVAVSEEIQTFAASELSSAAADTDFCARISDGRFALAFEAPDEERAREFMDELITKLNGFNNNVMSKYHITFQAGVYHLEKPNTPCEKALFNARHGFYHARENNLSCVFSDAKLIKREEYVLSLKTRLREALDKKEFRLYVQYIFDGTGQKACGAEALSRWDNPSEGMVSPGEFIKILEISEMIDELDFYILDECCRELEKWRDTPKKNIWLSCNMSRITLSNDSYMERFKYIVGKYDFNINQLVIEITEDALADDKSMVVENITACRELGCRISLDDFGSGYSSLKDLNDYPIDIIKIDKQLVEESITEQGKRLLSGIINLSHYLGIEALCEGIETKEELAVSTEAECDYIQGYLLSRTTPVDEPSVERNISFI